MAEQLTAMPASPNCTINTMPAELRLKIYDQVLDSFANAIAKPADIKEPPILSVCRTFRTEGLPEYHKKLHAINATLSDELLAIKKQLVRINYQYFPGMCGGGKYLWLIMEKYELEALEQRVEKTIAAIEGLGD